MPKDFDQLVREHMARGTERYLHSVDFHRLVRHWRVRGGEALQRHEQRVCRELERWALDTPRLYSALVRQVCSEASEPMRGGARSSRDWAH